MSDPAIDLLVAHGYKYNPEAGSWSKEGEKPAPVKEPVAPKPWVGLTRMELIKCGVLPFGMSYELYQAIEAKLKEKNT
jgi:hypothetical protein